MNLQTLSTKNSKKIILGICGGIAAYKSAGLASGLIKEGYVITVIMTEAAQRFVTKLTFRSLSGGKVYTDIFDDEYNENHVSLSKWADMIVVAPSTSTTIAKLRIALADNLLCATILDFHGPVLLCPAMHENMWLNKANQENCSFLKDNDYLFQGPETGALASGDKGIGRMSEPETIIEYIKSIL